VLVGEGGSDKLIAERQSVCRWNRKFQRMRKIVRACEYPHSSYIVGVLLS